jgi:MFS family permease
MRSQFSLRSLGPSVFLPATLYAIGQGAIAPAVVLTALELGSSAGTAGLMVGLIRLGQLVGDLPAGALAARVGERTAMLFAGFLVALALVVCLAAGSVVALGIAVFCTGLATAVWGLARQAYLTDVVPFDQRARAMSMLGGVQRIGTFVGPFLGAGAMGMLGTDGAYWVHLVVVAGAAAALLAVADPERERHRGGPVPGPLGAAGASEAFIASGTPETSEPSRTVVRGTAEVIRDHLPMLRTLGLGILLVGAVRASRQAVVPLWAEHVGLDPATTSLVFGISGAVDMLLFYPAGKLMDRVGRTWVAVPSMLILGLGHLLMPLTHDAVTIALASVVMGVGNGIGSGIIATIGADVAPVARRPEFLSAWRLCSDLGGTAGPSAIGLVTTVTSLAPALLVVAFVAGLSALALGRWIPRHAVAPP